jgi:hypothetical protein
LPETAAMLQPIEAKGRGDALRADYRDPVVLR